MWLRILYEIGMTNLSIQQVNLYENHCNSIFDRSFFIKSKTTKLKPIKPLIVRESSTIFNVATQQSMVIAYEQDRIDRISELLLKLYSPEVVDCLDKDGVSMDNIEFLHMPDLVKSINTITDKKKQDELFENYLELVKEHQKLKDEVILKLIDNKIDNSRTTIFGNRPFFIFLMCFPIIIGIFVVTVSKSYVFASFIILMWYGMILALYFSQSDALNKLLQNFAKLRRQ